MIIYNVTVSIDADIEEQWVKWMKEVHMIGGTENGVTYATQYECESLAKMQQYETKAAPALRADHQKHYEGKVAAFRTLLETV